MSTSEKSIARAQELGDAISGQPDNVDAALPELAALLAGPDEPELLIAVAMALGEAWDERAAELLLPFAGHADPLVREAVTMALPNGVVSAEGRARVTKALVRLAADSADEVRNWACFGLGQLVADGPDVRAALMANLDSLDLDTRSEALVALAKLGDPVSLSTTLERLGGNPDDVAVLDLQAAAELADPALLPVLDRLAEVWAGDVDEHVEVLEFARRRCQPDAAARAVDIEQQLLAGVNAALESGQGIRLEGGYPRTVAHLLAPTAGEPESYRVWDEDEPDSFDLDGEIASYQLAAQR